MIKRIGVLTGGGDCPGLNAVLRAVVKTSIIKYGYEVIGFLDGYRGLVQNRFIQLKSSDVSGILDKGGTILGTTNKDNPFNFKVVKDGEVMYKDMSDIVVENVKMHNIDCLVIIGGTGTITYADALSKKGLNIVCLPKTIDNDLFGTDITFGFTTAVHTATKAIDVLHSTAESHHRVMFLEVMGHKAGWIALEAGIAGGADVILIPEIPYDINKVAKKLLERKNSGRGFSIVVVSEGSKPISVTSKEKAKSEDKEPLRIGGVAELIAEEIQQLIGFETRVTVLGHLQRGGSPTPKDRVLSTRFGVAAMELVNNSQFGNMVCLDGKQISSIPLEEVAGKFRLVDPNGELVKIAKTMGVAFGD